jgi:serine phosphatase RsbU (regulator of sigma subunit)
LAAAFVPAGERVSGDFYVVAEGPQDSTVLVVGDVVGHAPLTDDLCLLAARIA